MTVTTTHQTVQVDADKLYAFSLRAFEYIGLKVEDAKICADALLQSELRCHPGQGQGVRRLRAYQERISKGWIDPNAGFEVLKESPALALINANNGLGSVIGRKAMLLAVEKAKVCGIGTVVVRGSTHYGSSAVHARVALEHSCIGIAYTNAGPEMAAWGGRTPVVGTNPWGIAAPTGADFPVVLDIALTTAGKGMMRYLAQEGKPMPTDWALTPEGEETDDPQTAMTGALLGIGQYKGYGLSLMTDVLTGVISGGAFGTAPYSDPAHLDVSHSFTAIDISWFMEPETFFARMQDLMHQIKASKLRPGFEAVYLPGEIDHLREVERRKQGIPLLKEHYDDLVALAKELELHFDIRKYSDSGESHV